MTSSEALFFAAQPALLPIYAALADAMAELMDHPEEVAIMREKALETYQSRFTGEVFARNTEQIYENVLKGASK